MTRTKEFVEGRAEKAHEAAEKNVALAQTQRDAKYDKAVKALKQLLSNGVLEFDTSDYESDVDLVKGGFDAVEALTNEHSPAVRKFYAFKKQIEKAAARVEAMEAQVESVDKIFAKKLATFKETADADGADEAAEDLLGAPAGHPTVVEAETALAGDVSGSDDALSE